MYWLYWSSGDGHTIASCRAAVRPLHQISRKRPPTPLERYTIHFPMSTRRRPTLTWITVMIGRTSAIIEELDRPL
jgi:hypothetical protein